MYFGNFSSGPTNKSKAWSVNKLSNAVLGRSHRSKHAMARLNHLQYLIRDILSIPESFKIAFPPASATGAMEMALWNLIGPQGANIISHDIFGKIWENDITDQLEIKNTHIIDVPFGQAPSLNDLQNLDFQNDTVLVSCATTTSTSINDCSWIPNERAGLTFVDASSSLFAEECDWRKFDVLIAPFQKVLGCEASLGIMILSPNAYKRLENYTPKWPIPRLLRLKNNGILNSNFFKNATINTPSMLLIEEYIATLEYYQNKGGVPYINQLCRENQTTLSRNIQQSNYFEFLCKEKKNRSIVNSCLVLKDKNTWANLTQITDYLETFGIYDTLGHQLSCPSIRIWHGPSIDKKDIVDFCTLLNKGYENTIKY